MSNELALPADLPTLAEALRGQDFATAGFVSGIFLGPRFGLARGFERYVVDPDPGGGRRHGRPRSAATDRVSAEGLAWLAARRRRPFFLFLHYFDIHSDYRPEPRFAALFGKPYQGPVDGTSRQLRAFLRRTDRLRRRRSRASGRSLRCGDPPARSGTRITLRRAAAARRSRADDRGRDLRSRRGVLRARRRLPWPDPVSGDAPRAADHRGTGNSPRPAQRSAGVARRPGADVARRSWCTRPCLHRGRDLAPLWKAPARRWPERSVFAEANAHLVRGTRSERCGAGAGSSSSTRTGDTSSSTWRGDAGERVNRAAAEPELAADLASQLTAASGTCARRQRFRSSSRPCEGSWRRWATCASDQGSSQTGLVQPRCPSDCRARR